MGRLAHKPSILGVVAASIVLIGMLAFGVASHATPSTSQARVREDLAAIHFPVYAYQRVVYQVNEGGSWFGRSYVALLGSLRNHVAAVGADNIDLRVVLHAKGVDLLRRPDARTRAAIDTLRGQGVRFLVCRNTLIETATEPVELYGVKESDLVPAGVAEIADLQAKGFIYLHL